MKLLKWFSQIMARAFCVLGHHPKSLCAFLILTTQPLLLAQQSVHIQDPADMADSSGDIAGAQAAVVGDFLHLSLTVHGFAAPTADQTPEDMSNRYYYHWLIDTDKNRANGRSNSD